MYLELKNINKKFGDYQASDQVSFSIEKGTLAALLGPSGSGKTTILRMIAGLEHQDSGDVLIDGVCVNDVPVEKRGIGFVFQNYALFPYMTVYDNIAYGLKLRKQDKQTIRKRVTELLDLVGLPGLENRLPGQLSGGQRQRVAFARALAPDPQLLLLDEPFAAIDAKVRKELRAWLKRMVEQLGITSIFVTHDQDEAVEVADEIIVTNRGRVEQSGTPIEIYKNPKTPFVAQFIGESIRLDGYDRLKGFSTKFGESEAVIRPEFVKAVRAGSAVDFPSAYERGIVEETAFRGSYTELQIDVKGLKIAASWPLEEEPLKKGDAVDVLIYRLYIFHDGETHLLKNELLTPGDVFYI